MNMYCPSCGKSITPGLSYCNHCGARLAEASESQLPGPGFNTLLGIVIGIPFVGLAMVFILIAGLKNGMGFRDDFIFGVIFLTFVLLALAETVFAILLLSRSKAAKPVKLPTASESKELPSAPTLRGLGGPTFDPTPVGSVTDHTTRTLDKVPKDRE